MRIRNAFFSLTAEERKIVVFVLSAFVLGVSVKHCRDVRREKPLSPAKVQPADRLEEKPGGPEAVPNPD